MKVARLLFLIAAVLAGSIPLCAQVSPDLEQGMKPYGSYQGGNLDRISMSNGNLFFHADLLSYFQRGGELAYPIALQYNSENFSLFQPISPCPQGLNPGNQGCPLYTLFGPPIETQAGGVSVGNSVTVGFEAPPGVIGNGPDPGFNSGLSYYGNPIYVQTYSVMTPDGSLHPLANTNSGKIATDGSGFSVDANGNVWDRHGNRFGSAIEDANGNRMTVSTSGTWTDTLGRSIPAMPGPVPTATPAASTASLGACPALGYSFQPASYAYTWSLPTVNGGTLPLILCYASVRVRTGSSNGPGRFDVNQTFNMLQSVIFPDNTYWAFQYDAADPNNTASFGLGDLLKITLPTGGTIAYTFGTRSDAVGLNRTVVTRTVDANDGKGLQVWQYSYSLLSIVNGNQTMYTTVTDPLPNDTVHTMTGLGGKRGLYETQVQYFQGSKTAGTLLRTVSTDYQFTDDHYSVGGAPQNVANVLPIRVTTTLPNGLASKVETDYDTALAYHGPLDGITYNVWVGPSDPNPGYWSGPFAEPVTNYTGSYGKVVATREYDWGQGAPGPLLRQTTTQFLWQANNNYQAANLLDTSCVVTVYGPGTVPTPTGCTLPGVVSNQMAQTTYGYDEYALNASNIGTQHNSSPVNGSVRGNLTSVHHWLNGTAVATANCSNAINNGFATAYTRYNDTGTVYQSTDACGSSAGDPKHTTTHTYDPAYAGAYPTHTCNALNQCVSGTYDFNTGLPTSFTDANQQTGNFSYDQRQRLTQALGPTDPTSGVRPETDFDYSVLNQVKRNKKQDASHWIFDYAYFDGLGRTKQMRLVDPEGDDFVETTYDAVGRVATVSNPHRSTSSSTDGTTQTFYDALGRVTQITAQDGSIFTTDYSNFPTVTVTDPAGKVRRSRSDALGRLVEVDEPGPGVNGPGTPGQGTITVSGSLQSSTSSGTKATGSFTVGGGEQSFTMPGACYPDPVTGLYNCDPSRTIYDSGSVEVDVNGWPASTTYDQSTTSADSVAGALAAGFGAAGSPVTAYYPGGKTVYLTANQPGPNYALGQKVAYDQADFKGPSFSVTLSGPSLTGGVYPATTYDSGTLTVTVGGFQASASYNQNLNTTALAMTQALTSALNASSSPVTASNNGSTTITITAKGVGTSTNFGVTGSSTASFTASSTTLSGGTNPGGLYADYVTNYSYEALGNLLSVNQLGDSSQPARVRTFTYDSLSRLLTANNPESGTICYGVWASAQCVNGYDANGNLVAKTDARGITTSYGYDALNRLTQKSFSNGDPTLVLSYDSYSGWSSGSSIGRLVRTGQANSLGHNFAYDPLGRVTGTWQCLPSDCNAGASVSAQYNLAGGLTQLTYPNGQKVTFTPNSAGRDVSAIDSTNNINFATAAAYSPDGALAGFVSGNSGSFAGITNSFSYNKRLQPVSMLASSPTQTVLSLNYDFHTGAGDNGNLFAIVNNKDTSRNQIFTYDQLNRLASAQNAGTDCTKKTLKPNQTEYWGNSYTYDAWGNLLAKTVTKCSAEYLSESADTQNRMHVTSGPDYNYDAAGNMTYDATGGHHYAYDAQSQITQVDSGTAATYTYDAEGHRLRKDSGSSPSTEYVYFGDDIVAEKNVATGAWTNYVFFDGRRVARQDFSSNAVSYYFSDHLKTADVITDAGGNIKSESDYYPWGGELAFSANDSNHYKFTGKERDTETGLDYFEARYYSSGLGRFITPDWSATPVPIPYADLDDPQSLNQYSYVRNIPTTKMDADGHCDATGTTNCSLWDHVAGVFGGLINIVPETANIPTQMFNAVSGHFGGPQLEEAPLIQPGEHASQIGINLGIQAQVALPAAEVAAEATTARMAVGEVRTATAGAAEGEAAGARAGSVRGGETADTALGRQKHAEFADKVGQKPGWQSEPRLTDPKTGKIVKPDALSKAGRPVELKPKTASGRASGRTALRKYERSAGKKGRVIYYDKETKQ